MGERFHQATADIPVPGWHRRRSDPFARADQAAWDGAVLSEFTTLGPVARLAGQLRPVGRRAQLIHGDLSGNVLFHPDLPPAIIDLSPYWRPALFATAIVVIDAMIWEGADRSVLSVIDGRSVPISTCCAPPSSVLSWTTCATRGAPPRPHGGLPCSGSSPSCATLPGRRAVAPEPVPGAFTRQGPAYVRAFRRSRPEPAPPAGRTSLAWRDSSRGGRSAWRVPRTPPPTADSGRTPRSPAAGFPRLFNAQPAPAGLPGPATVHHADARALVRRAIAALDEIPAGREAPRPQEA